MPVWVKTICCTPVVTDAPRAARESTCCTGRVPPCAACMVRRDATHGLSSSPWGKRDSPYRDGA
eukprot:5396058-Prorocentrum_lima.AAC.1